MPDVDDNSRTDVQPLLRAEQAVRESEARAGVRHEPVRSGSGVAFLAIGKGLLQRIAPDKQRGSNRHFYLSLLRKACAV